MDSDNPLIVYQLLRIANFGRKSLGDPLFTADDFLSECIEREPSTYPVVPRSRYPYALGTPGNRSGVPHHRAPGLPHQTRPAIAWVADSVRLNPSS